MHARPLPIHYIEILNNLRAPQFHLLNGRIQTCGQLGPQKRAFVTYLEGFSAGNYVVVGIIQIIINHKQSKHRLFFDSFGYLINK